MSLRVAFVGLGHMGAPMCARIVDGGFPVAAYDRRPEAVAAAAAGGADAARTAAEAAASADILVTMLPGPAQVEDVLLGSGGALEALAPGAVAVDMSTSAPALGRRIAAAAAEHGVAFLDAPVADALRASEGDLHIFVGGEGAVLDRVRPVLETMGRPERVVHVGPHGAGYAVKLLVNLQWFVHAAAAAEALVAGARLGIDLESLHNLLAVGPARSSFIEHEALEVLRDGEYGERFPLGLVAKDLRLALELTEEAGVPATVAQHTAARYEDARRRFGDGAGEMAVVQLYEDLTGTPLRFGGDGAH